MSPYSLDLRTAYGRLQMGLDMPGGEISLADFARAVLPLGQRFADLMESAYARAGKPASCRKGCGACCREEVPISAPEALMLSEYHASLPGPEFARISARFAAIREHVRKTGAGGQDLPGGASSEAIRAQGLAWFKQGQACPFLENEICTAHATRPVPCRNHLAISPAAHCADPGAGGIRAMNPRVSVSTILALVTAEFMREEPLKLPLAGLEDWVALHPAYAERRFAGEALARRFVELLEDFCRRSLPAPKGP